MKIKYFGLFLLSILFFSCTDIFSGKDNLTDETVEVRGIIKVQLAGAYPSAFAEPHNSRKNLRNAVPDGVVLELEYLVKAERYIEGQDEPDKVFGPFIYDSSDVNAEFVFKLTEGNWVITAEGTTDGGMELRGIENITISLAKPNKNNIKINASPIRLPADDGHGNIYKGNIDLPLSFSSDAGFTKITAQWNQGGEKKQENYTLSEGDTSVRFYVTDVPVGIYEVVFVAYRDEYPVYRCKQSVNVFGDMTTNGWFQNGESEYLMKEGSTTETALPGEKSDFYISDVALNNFKRYVFYVAAADSTADNNNGTYFDPYNSIQKAIDRVIYENDKATEINEYTIYLMSDFEFEEDSTEDIISYTDCNGSNNKTMLLIHNTKELKLTLASYDENKKTINANLVNEKASLFSVYASKNIKINLEGLILKNGNSNSSGGGFFLVTPVGILIESTIKNCEFINNKARYGAGLYFVGNQGQTKIITLEDVVVKENYLETSNAIADGYGAGICFNGGYDNKSSLTLKNCQIIDNGVIIHEGQNDTTIGGGLYSRSNVTGYNGTVKLIGENIFTGNSAAIYGGIYYSNNLEISGKLNISENTNGLGKESNICVYGAPIKITEALDPDTRIGITIKNEDSLEYGTASVFTSGYKDFSNYAPNKFFYNDSGKCTVVLDSDEAAMFISGGNVDEEIYCENLYMKLQPHKNNPGLDLDYIPGFEAKYSIYIETSYNEELTQEQYETVTYDGIKLMTRQSEVPAEYYSFSPENREITLHADLPPALYELYVSAKYDGRSYSIILKIPCGELLSMVGGFKEGLSSNTYYIGSAEDMRILEKWMNESTEALAGTYVLCADIDLGKWNGLGHIENENNEYSGNTWFNGTFEGNGHSITYDGSTSTEKYSGLFNLTNTGAKIRNLTVKGKARNGGIVGYTYRSLSIENCISYVDIDGEMYVGGIVGKFTFGTIKNCINYGNVKGNKTGTTTVIAGGLVGMVVNSTTNIENSINYGTITVDQPDLGASGGILGQTTSPSGTYIRNCINVGLIDSADSTKSGGIVGYYSTSTKVNAQNSYYIETDGITTGRIKGGDVVGECDSFTINESSALAANSATVGSYTGTNVVELLNAWVATKKSSDGYLNWAYDDTGLPKLQLGE